jgi:uncharacterized pyridoxamine 5'-phosphate oxidase family protein
MSRFVTEYPVKYRNDGRIEIPKPYVEWFIKRNFSKKFYYQIFKDPDLIIIKPGSLLGIKSYELKDTIRVPKSILKHVGKLNKIFHTSENDIRLTP